MAQKVSYRELKTKGVVAVRLESHGPFPPEEIDRLTQHLQRFALVFDGDNYQILSDG